MDACQPRYRQPGWWGCGRLQMTALSAGAARPCSRIPASTAIAVSSLKAQTPVTESSASCRTARGASSVTTNPNFVTWQSVGERDAHILWQSRPVLVVGSWLLALLAVGGAATLAAGRNKARRVAWMPL